jgi:hypothetical protein
MRQFRLMDPRTKAECAAWKEASLGAPRLSRRRDDRPEPLQGLGSSGPDAVGADPCDER